MGTTNDTSRAKRPTIEDVASEAGVSVATVSRAMRALPNVAISTRHHVIAVAERLGYSADPAASRLAAGTTKTITVVIPNLSGWYFSTVVAGAEAVCAEEGYDVLVVGVGSRKDLSRILSEHYHLERRTDGLVVIDVVVTPDQAESITRRGVALTSVGSRTAGRPSVRIDNELVGRLAANHLVGLGHERLGIIGAQKDNPMSSEVPSLRQCGFVDSLANHGLAFDDDLHERGNFGIDGGQEAMAALLDHSEPPTAVFSMSDEMAFGAIMELSHRGLVAGRDVSIIGVDDHEFSRVVDLTTIRQRVASHGAAAARLLIDAIQQGDHQVVAAGAVDAPPAESAEIVAPVELVVRGSTGRIGPR
jgi:LacI family repressor for deo operon, udp, cdd, tsx, nupC, and nupG